MRVNSSKASFAVPSFVDCHTHLDKTGIILRTGRADGDLVHAIGVAAAQRDAFTAPDVHARADRALEQIHRHGTIAVRTHVDWVTPDQPVAWEVLHHLAQAWAGKVAVQLANLTPLELFADASVGESIARAIATTINRCHAMPGAVLGVYVRGQENQARLLRTVFQLAERFDLLIDFHVDESGDASLQGVDQIARLALQQGNGDRVLLGHACALAQQEPSQALATLDRLAQSGCHLVSLPSTNLYLQGRSATGVSGTPRWRGITLVQEALARGIGVSFATDNVRDPFYPYGDYDLQSTARLGALAAHLSDAAQVAACVSTAPASAMHFSHPGTRIEFFDAPSSTSCIDWLAANQRTVLEHTT
jgi:cytosine/creatinine deaminase